MWFTYMTPEQRSFCMSRIHAKNTRPELLLRHSLWRCGFRYRVNDKKLPGCPDIVLPKYRTAIFVHGCFWHGHKDCKYYSVPKANTDYWVAKLARNKKRDQEVWRKLEAKGWYVIIVWECQLKKGRIDETVERVVAEIVQNGEAYRAELEARRKVQDEYHRNQKAKKERERALQSELKSGI